MSEYFSVDVEIGMAIRGNLYIPHMGLLPLPGCIIHFIWFEWGAPDREYACKGMAFNNHIYGNGCSVKLDECVNTDITQ